MKLGIYTRVISNLEHRIHETTHYVVNRNLHVHLKGCLKVDPRDDSYPMLIRPPVYVQTNIRITT